MCSKFSKTETNLVERIDGQNVSVTVTSGPSKGKSYILFASKLTGTVGSCSCSWGRRNGTTCSHVRDAMEFVAAERAVKPAAVETKSSFQKWLEEAEADGDIIFASR